MIESSSREAVALGPVASLRLGQKAEIRGVNLNSARWGWRRAAAWNWDAGGDDMVEKERKNG